MRRARRAKAPPPMTTIVQFENVGLRYGSGPEMLTDVSFSLQSGSFPAMIHIETKARYGFVYGDFRRVHRMGVIACHYRAAEWGHKEIELVAHDLLQLLDATRA